MMDNEKMLDLLVANEGIQWVSLFSIGRGASIFYGDLHKTTKEEFDQFISIMKETNSTSLWIFTSQSDLEFGLSKDGATAMAGTNINGSFQSYRYYISYNILWDWIHTNYNKRLKNDSN